MQTQGVELVLLSLGDILCGVTAVVGEGALHVEAVEAKQHHRDANLHLVHWDEAGADGEGVDEEEVADVAAQDAGIIAGPS